MEDEVKSYSEFLKVALEEDLTDFYGYAQVNDVDHWCELVMAVSQAVMSNLFEALKCFGAEDAEILARLDYSRFSDARNKVRGAIAYAAPHLTVRQLHK